MRFSLARSQFWLDREARPAPRKLRKKECLKIKSQRTPPGGPIHTFGATRPELLSPGGGFISREFPGAMFVSDHMGVWGKSQGFRFFFMLFLGFVLFFPRVF